MSSDENWMLVLEPGSRLSEIWGAYRLHTVRKFSEHKVLPSLPGRPRAHSATP